MMVLCSTFVYSLLFTFSPADDCFLKKIVLFFTFMVATGQEIVREKNSSRSGKSQGISL